MSLDPEAFEVHRWHSAEYVDSWVANQTREAERRPLRQRLAALLPFVPGDAIRVLDLGAGAGASSLEILSVYPKAEIVCQDFSEAMLAHARQLLSPYAPAVTFVTSDLGDPAWRQVVEGTFDSVITSLTLHNVPDRRIREIYREVFGLVKPGGCFLNCDHVAPPGRMLKAAYLKARLNAYRDRVKAETGKTISLAEAEHQLSERRRLRPAAVTDRVRRRSAEAPTLMRHLEWLDQAGFDEVDCLWKDMRHAIIGGFRHDR